MEFKNISEELQEMLDKAEELDWTYKLWQEERGGRTYVEMFKPSDAGEDFGMCIDFEKDNQAETFLQDLKNYAEDFDVNEHAEMWLPSRGKGGCPSSLRELLDDAESIKKMCEELAEELDKILYPELSDEQTARCDEIYNAVYGMCKVLAEDENLEWDMHYIGEIAELAANLLLLRGCKIHFPSVVTYENGRQRVKEYYEPEEEKC